MLRHFQNVLSYILKEKKNILIIYSALLEQVFLIFYFKSSLLKHNPIKVNFARSYINWSGPGFNILHDVINHV